MSVRGAQSKDAPKYDDTANNYDAILVVSFGGPEGMEDVIPFMQNVTKGRNIPRERLEEVSEHYFMFDGVSPINEQNRQLIAALEDVLADEGPDLPVYFGNRNWHPLLDDTLQQMKDDGVQRAIAFFTSAFSSYSGCRQYRENIMAAQKQVGDDAPEIDRIRMFYNHPGYIEPMVELTKKALDEFDKPAADVRIAFSAHSIPMGMANNSNYVAQLEEACRLVAEGIGTENYDLVYQSRSGPPHVPWLEPDILDYMDEIHAEDGIENLVIVPIGFISDHMEVIFDLDTEGVEKADELGMKMVRAGTVGTHPTFVKMVRDLIVERMSANPQRPALGERGPVHDICPVGCCLEGASKRPQTHGKRPAATES